MSSPKPTLILASTSTYRARLLSRLGLPFQSVAPTTDETPRAAEIAEHRAARLSREKALSVAAEHPGSLVIGSDQVASIDSRVLRKPGAEAIAIEQLSLASGKTMVFYTGVCLCDGPAIVGERLVETQVNFRPLSHEQICAYVRREPALDCAGSFRWEGLGISLFESLHSEDPTALEGLPLIAVTDLLLENSIEIY
ncbi:MAG: nucleoside triphosphate pyrophosphatase [Congregibacter sp.]